MLFLGSNYTNPVTTANVTSQPDYSSYAGTSAANSTTLPAQAGFPDSVYNPATHSNQPVSNTATNNPGPAGQDSYNYNVAGYNYYQYSTQPTAQAQDTTQNTQQTYPSSYTQSTYGATSSPAANQSAIYTQPSSYQPTGYDGQAVYNQAGYNMAAMYGGTVTQAGYTQPVTQTTYTYPQGSYNQNNYVQPTTQSGYVQPTTQASYVQPTNHAGYTPLPTHQLNQSAAQEKSLDTVLSERMAALMPKSKKDANPNPYVPTQYPQYDQVQGYNQADNYSYANTNMPVNSYYTMSNTNYPYVTTSEQSAVDVANYSSAVNATVTATITDTTYGYSGQGGTYPTSKCNNLKL